MKISLITLICLLREMKCSETAWNLSNYLNDQTKIVSDKLIRFSRSQEHFFDVKFANVSTMKLNGNYSGGDVFTIFDTSYALMGQDLYKISRSNCTMVHKFSLEGKTKLVRSTGYQTAGLLALVTQSGILHLFGVIRGTQTFFTIQNIVHRNISEIAFFQNRNNLYLVLANNQNYDLTTVVFYKFLNSHFDEIEKLSLTSATKLYTFPNNESEIIVILRDFEMTSFVYKFKNETVKLIQKIDTVGPTHVLSYVLDTKTYVLVFQKTNQIERFLWTGSKLTLWETMRDYNISGEKLSILYSANNPYLVNLKNNTFLIYSLANSQINSTLNTNLTKVWTYQNTPPNSTKLIILGQSELNETEINTISISIESGTLVENLVERDTLDNCFTTLEKTVFTLRQNLLDTQNSNDRRLKEAAHQQSPIQKLYSLHARTLNARNAITDLQSDPKKLVVNRTVIIKNSLNGTKVIAKELHFEKLNNQKWEPERWLSYTQPQRILGTVKIHTIEVNNLTTNENDKLFDDLLLSKGNQSMLGSLTVNKLQAAQLETGSINNIPFDNFYLKSKPVTIQGLKKVPKLYAKNMKSNNINGMNGTKIATYLSNLSSVQYNFKEDLKVDDLWVDTINGVNFEIFKRSLFRVGITDTIRGNLTFVNVNATNMIFRTLSKTPSVLTTSTDQIINSSITISKIFAQNIKTDTINSVDFKNTATFDGGAINGPVRIDNVKVKNNLQMKGNLQQLFLKTNKTHIVGTDESDFLQRYNGNVTIRGNLFLKNLILGKSANLTVAGEALNPKIDQFWTKTTQQEIPTHFEALNGVSTPHIFAKYVNNVSVSDYFLNSTEQKASAKFYFENITVRGNIILNPEGEHLPDLQRIQTESVKINGTFKIKGHKKYNILKIDKLDVTNKNNFTISDVAANNSEGTSGPKNIKNLTIKGNFYCKNVSVKRLNNVDLNRLTEKSLYIDKPLKLEALNFKNVSAKELFLIRLNGHDMNDVVEKIDNISKIHQIKDLYIEGNVTIKNIKNVATINDQDVEQLMKDSIEDYHDHTIFDSTRFLGHVKVKNLFVTVVNDVNLPKLTERILYKSWNQTIVEQFNFTNIKSKNLVTNYVNDVYVRNMIDISSNKQQQIFVPNGLKFSDLTKIQNLSANFNCDIQQALRNLKNPPRQMWNNVVIKGDVSFWDKESLISNIFDKVVTQESNSVIRAKVRFTQNIFANNVTTLKTINGIDLKEFVEDAFLNQPETEQVVTGKKTFVQLEADEVVGLGHIDVSMVNDINIFEINDKIIDRNSVPLGPIRGKKVFFGGLQTKNLETSSVAGVNPSDLVSFVNSNPIENAIFESVSVTNDLNVGLINNMPLDNLLNERLLKTSDKQSLIGNYFFTDITINGNVSTPQINDIFTQNVVYDDQEQIIESSKRFSGNLTIVGDVKVELINGLKLSEIYEQAVLINEDTIFNGSVVILAPVQINGNIQTKYINNVPVEYLIDTNAELSRKIEEEKIYKIMRKLEDFVTQYLNATIRIPTELQYLEKSTDLQVSIANTVSARIVETKDDILIHIESEEDGSFCGLPKTCKCPSQQTLQISSEHSVNVFTNKASQRIYSYYDQDMIAHVISNSISTDSYCRTSKTKVLNEVSSLTWNTTPQENSTGGFFMHQPFFAGYISGVKFFATFGKTYVVVGFYYDPVLDTHNVNCVVLRFNEDKTETEEIQRIPTVGTKTISLVHTVQGVVLIVGNQGNVQFNNATTQIFRFEHHKERFEFLRDVPTFGTVFAEGVVLESDSLIVLANEHSVLHILKYQAEFDNYYFYHNFQLDYPVSSMSVFYVEGFGISDAYLSVVTKNDKYFMYSFHFIEGWKLESVGEIDGIKSLIPFKLNNKSYLLAPSSKLSSLFTLVEHDSD